MINWDPANPEAALYHHRAVTARSAALATAAAGLARFARRIVRRAAPALRQAVAGRPRPFGDAGRAGPCAAC